ncbi:MAG: ABC transporter permease [Anaerotignum sp.]|nr:ABC transporter permease [Anaerotignum sp.]MBQ7085067.1 ABC transporter permease [Anaerotignum sp.]MBR2062532.1 ABC transporter permease [Anaerotignum sp.]MBR2852236.1 ABC transporter permease [Anaerotignum sp.]MBR3910313.1 ABC transporter permease [Anaerotignum sp.]
MLNEIIGLICQTDFVFSIFRITAPILFAALASVVAEKAGVVNIGLDGIMLISGLFGTLFSFWTQSWLIGVLGAMAVGLTIALIMGFFALKLKTDIILAGIAINTMAGGGTIFALYMFTGERGNTASLTSSNILIPTVEIPGLSSIPVLGDILSGHSVLTYIAFILVFVTWVLLYKTSVGLQIRAVGENDHAAESVGISVLKIKYIALGISGILAGMGGAFMSMYYSQSWNTGVVAGRGFIALAAQAMGHGEPVGTMFASLLFGFAQALRTKVSGIQGVSSNLISAMPYAVTILGLVLYALSTINKAKRKKAQEAEKKD